MKIIGWAIVFMGGCTTVGPSAAQRVDSIDEKTFGPSQTRMVDGERGTLTTAGSGPTSWKRLDAQGVETMGTGVAPRTIYWDAATQRLVLDSGTDIAAEGVRVDVTESRTTIEVKKFQTLTSGPTLAVNEAYPTLAEVWRTYSQDQKEARLAELAAMAAMGDALAGAMVKVLLGL